MGNKTRDTGNLVASNNIFVDVTNDRVGIGSTQPRSNLDVVGVISATTLYVGGSEVTGGGGGGSTVGIATTGTSHFSQLNVTGVSTFTNRIVGAATNNAIPFLYTNFSDLPSASTFHGAFAHVHARNKAYFAHSANWWELVNKEQDGTIGVGTEQVNVGVLTATTLFGDGGGLTNVTGSGAGVTITSDGAARGLTGTLNFGSRFPVTAVSAGVVTVTHPTLSAGLDWQSATSMKVDLATDPGLEFQGGDFDTSALRVKIKSGGGIVRDSDGLSVSGGAGISTTASNIQATWNVTSNGSSAYRFTGPGQDGTENDPDLYLLRGQKYRFVNNSGGSHPFQIRWNENGNAYSDGVTNNGASSGDIEINVQHDAPDLLFYQCTVHSGMVGRIHIMGDTINSGSWTASAGTEQIIDTITAANNNQLVRTVEYTLHFNQGNDMQAQKVLLMSNGTNVFSQEYGIMFNTGTPLVSIGATITNAGILNLNATPNTGVTGTMEYYMSRKTIR